MKREKNPWAQAGTFYSVGYLDTYLRGYQVGTWILVRYLDILVYLIICTVILDI